MNARTLKALRGSIRKWVKIVKGTGTDEGPDNCPLCGLFYDHLEYCEGCPVMKKSGAVLCRNTPYADFTAAPFGSDAFAAAAKAELKFLRSLLPKKRPSQKQTKGTKGGRRSTTDNTDNTDNREEGK